MENSHIISTSLGDIIESTNKISAEDLNRNPIAVQMVLANLSICQKELEKKSKELEEKEEVIEHWRTLAEKRDKLIPRKKDKWILSIINFVATILVGFFPSNVPYNWGLGLLGLATFIIINGINISGKDHVE